MNLYADENFPLRVVEGLRRLGHDVLTALEDGKANQSIPDKDLLARATAHQRALLTLNRLDFKRLHREMPNHAGIIICTEDPDRTHQASHISLSIVQTEDLRGKLVRIYRREQARESQ